jgi:hypothetical protein
MLRSSISSVQRQEQAEHCAGRDSMHSGGRPPPLPPFYRFGRCACVCDAMQFLELQASCTAGVIFLFGGLRPAPIMKLR